MSREIVLGLDLGTSSLKGVAVRPTGQVLATASLPYPTVREDEGQAEQEPDDWQRALAGVVRTLLDETEDARPVALGLAAMIPTLVPAGPDGTPLGRAVTWEDARAAGEGEALRGAGDALFPGEKNGLYRRTGQWVDGRYLLPMWERWRRAAGAAPNGARPLAAKDHLFFELTGEFATDPSTATGFGVYDLETGSWLADATERAFGDAVALPDVLPPATTRPLTPSAARRLGLPASLPVCLGAADSVLAALALGATAPGDVAYMAGTSTVILGVAEAPLPDSAHRHLVTPLAAGHAWGFEMDLLSTGSAVQWLCRLLGLGEEGQENVIRLAEEATPRDELLFAPFLGGGEQGALWDERLRGAVIGLDLSVGRGELARALLDGIALESRRCLAVLEEAGVAGPLRVAGAGVRSAAARWRLADATGRDVLFADVPSPSGTGAALLAARAAKVVADDETWTLPAERTAPDPAARAHWNERWRRHAALVDRLHELYRESAEQRD